MENDDCALAQLLAKAALNQCAHFTSEKEQYDYVCGFMKRQLDLTLRPLTGNTYGEWSIIIISDSFHGRLVCSMYLALYIPRWRKTMILIYN